MFSFLQKINISKKFQEKKQERKSSLRRKDSTVSVPSLDFSYNPGMIESQSGLNSLSNKAGSASYRHITPRADPSQDDLKTKKNRLDRKSNLSLASFGSGYFTTGRAYEHKKKSNTNSGINYKRLVIQLLISPFF